MRRQSARPRLGQHFLRDTSTAERIIDAFGPGPTDCIVEIGPGEGVLTRPLAVRGAQLHAVELDRELAAALMREFSARTNVHIHHADALAFDYCALTRAQPLRVIGNLPYGISTPLLFHLLEHAHCIRDMCFMLQREVAERICADPGTRTYGRLSVMLQWRCRVERLFNVKPGAFRPPPKVESAVLRLWPHTTPPVAVADGALFGRVVAAAFAQRRKTLRNALKDFFSGEDLQRLGIEPRRRGETLTLAEFAALANALAHA